nr:MAG TPA: hypothetical protein [Caudoviricetes sp.]
MRYLCVFNKTDKDKLLNMGYQLISHSSTAGIWYFQFNDKINYSLKEIKYTISNTLVF